MTETVQPKVQIDVFSDPICPWCYIGKKRMDEALSMRPEVDIEIRWRAFQLNPDMPTDGMDRQAYLSAKFGGEERASQVYRQIEQVGRDTDIEFKFDAIPRTPNTVDAHRLIRRAQEVSTGHGERVVTGLFEAYFLEGRDIGDRAVQLEIAEAAGMEPERTAIYLDTDADRRDVLSEDVFGRRLGINGVPCFIVGGKYALSGAQEPEAFLPLIDMALEEARKAASDPVQNDSGQNDSGPSDPVPDTPDTD